jgi:hypothetical protein
MAISTTVPTSRPETTALVIFGIVASLIVAVVIVLDLRAAPIRAAAAQALSAELAAEDKAFCEKHGMRADTQAHSACVADVQTIRDGQTKRMNRDHQFGVL